jgi:hypothetical protein
MIRTTLAEINSPAKNAPAENDFALAGALSLLRSPGEKSDVSPGYNGWR